MQSPSLPADSPQVVSIDSLKAALAKLNTKVPVDDVISAIREVEQTKRGQPLAQSPERRAALESERKLSPIALVVSLNLSNMPVIHPESSSDVQTTTTSHCVPYPPTPGNVPENIVPISKKERRRRLIEFTKAFSRRDGKVPEPISLGDAQATSKKV